MSSINDLPNKNLSALTKDTLYHLGFDTDMDLKALFGDVKFVLFGGSNDRMYKVAKVIAQDFFPLKFGQTLTTIGSTVRYHMYKVGPIITCSHQMGMPSFSILLHEMTKLLKYAGATDFSFIRIGTSGGVGVPGGSVVITDIPVNGYLEPCYEIISLGKSIKRDASLDQNLIKELMECATGLDAIHGKTMSVDCFYEGQGRLDGAICYYTEEEKLDFLKKAYDAGVRNIEMESAMFGAFCKEVNIPAAVVCCTLLNRLNGDQVTMTAEQYSSWMDKVILVCERLIAKRLNIAFNK